MKKIILFITVSLLIIASILAYTYYQKIYAPNISVTPGNEFLYINTGSTFNDVKNKLTGSNTLKNSASFEWVAAKMNYGAKVLPGKYALRDGMSNKELISLLRSGKQTPVKVTFNNMRTIQLLAGRIAQQLETDSATLLHYIQDSAWHTDKNISPENLPAVFIPNTYEFYWNTSASRFVERMYKEYKKFWNESRLAKASKLGLSPYEISTLASIVEQETKKNDEKPIVAGVYLNRLAKGMKLEADPTLIFALGDFSIKRVLNIHKEIDSKYNTYLHIGLPPGPISIPEISSIDAVLNYSSHDYLFFCAREDLSGYHAFAVTYAQHLVNAKKYHTELNRRNIK